MTRTANPLGTTVGAVWLELLKAQRPIRYWELTQALPELSCNQKGASLNVAYRLGYLERSGRPRAYEYRVTPRCVVPPGLVLLDVIEAVG